VPPRPALEINRAMLRQIYLVGMMQATPRFGAIEGMMRIGKRGPDAELAVLVGTQELDGAITDPGRVMPSDRQTGVMGLRRIGDRLELFHQQAVLLLAAAIGVVPALVMLSIGRQIGRAHV